MNEKLVRNAGFGKFVDKVNQGLCPICGKKIDMKDFTDECSRREFKISGICQVCQDKTFGKED